MKTPRIWLPRPVERVVPNALSPAVLPVWGRRSRPFTRSGFTLVELLIGLSLSLTIMAAVLSSYLFIGRSLSRLVNQQTLETEGRRTLAIFTQDVRASSAISGTPSVSAVTLTIPSGASTTTIAWSYNSTTGILTRTPASGTARTLVSNLTSLQFRYYNEAGTAYDNGSSPFTTQTEYMSGLKQISLAFTSQTGSANNGTLTGVHSFASPRLLVRNRALLN